MSLAARSITELLALLDKGEIRPSEIVDDVAVAVEARDKTIGGYLSVDWERARRAAEAADPRSLLKGIPVAIKDLISVEGEPCTCGSRMLENYRSPYDAGAIVRLKHAGGVPCGRLNMDEFAMGSTTENSALGVTRNPWDTSRSPGGSSGGSAAVVAADEAVAALGSDTGGSIRQPAAWCGCVGMKPSYGRVSRYGLVAFASSLDQIGPVAKTVEDAAILLQAISGHDPRDSTSLDEPVEDYREAHKHDIAGMRIGLPKEYFVEGMDAEVRAAIMAAAKQFEDLGARIVEVSLPNTDYGIAVYYIIATAEASANLARFDGVRYGHRAAGAKNLHEHYFRSRAEGFGSEVKRRILLGTYVLSSGYYEAYYLRAQKLRSLIREDFSKAFQQVDALLTPVTPGPAFRLGETSSDPLAMYLADVCTIGANLVGICGLSLPCGFQRLGDRELPIGLQLLGPAFAEARLLRLGKHYEVATEWHKRKPPLA